VRTLPRRSAHYFNGNIWENAGILIETEARTNLIIGSNVLDTGTGWTTTNAAAMAKDAVGPWNTDTGQAWTLVDDSATGTGNVRVTSPAVGTDTGTHTFSIYARASGVDHLALRTSGFTIPPDGEVIFNLTAGTTTDTGLSDTGLGGFIEQIDTGGWHRCSVVFDVDTGDVLGNIIIGAADTGGEVVDLDGTSSILIWGAQYEKGGPASSHIPTDTGATVTRDADGALTIPAAQLDFPGTSGDFSIQIDGTLTYADEDANPQMSPLFWNVNGSIHYRITMRTGTPTASNTGRFESNLDDTTAGDYEVETPDASISPGINKAYNIATRQGVSGTDEMNMALDGAAETAISIGTALPDLSTADIDIATDVWGYMGHVGQFRQWSVDIGDAGIEEAST
jgi:hypothetical protein